MLRAINEDNGLPSNCVLDLFVDGEGLLWVSTNKGLYRYDGFGYERIGAGTGLDEVNIVAIKELPRLGLTVLAAYGGRLFTYAHGTVREVPLQQNGWKRIDSGSFTGLVLDEEGRLHAGYTGGLGHHIIDLERGTIQEVASTSEHHEGRMELVDGQALSWLTRPAIGFGLTDSIALPAFKGALRLSEECVHSHIFAGTYANGTHWMAHCKDLFVFANETVHRRHMDGRLLGLTEDAQGRCWVRMWDAGLVCCDRDLNILPYRDPRLENTHVTACVQDRQGGLWFGTIDRGLYHCADPDIRFYAAREVLHAPWISTLLAAPDGGLYAGTGNGQVYHIGREGSLKLLMNAEQLAGSEEIKGMMIHEGVLLPGRLDRGWSLTGKDPVELTSRHQRWRHTYAMAPAGGGRYVMGSILGARLVDFGALEQEGRSILAARTYAIAPDLARTGHYLATNEGLWHLRHTDTPKETLQRIGSPVRTYDAQWANGCLWLATHVGAFVLQGDSLVPVRLNTDEAQPRTRALAMEGDRWLWFATLEGLYRKDLHAPPDQLPEHIGRSRGLPSDAVTDVVVSGDRVWAICGPDLVGLPLSGLQRTIPDAPLNVVGICGNDQPGEGAAPHFPHTVEQITVRLRNHDYARHTKTPFRYRADPDAPWSFTASPEIQLVSLEPGSYRLEVQSMNGMGRWSAPVFAQWVIATPFWDTFWFKSLLVLAGLGGLFGLVLYVRERRHREALLAATAEQFHHKALLAQMEPHFLYNALNSIQGFVAGNNSEAAIRYIARFAKLMRGLLHAAHTEQVTLADEVAMLENYCALEALRSEPRFAYTIIVHPQLDAQRTLLPSFMVQPYVENAIRHGLRNLRGERAGELHIRFQPGSDGALVCTVEDNGVGRAATRATNEQGAGWRSYGTAINAERAHVLQRMGTPVAISTEDLRTADGPAAGTRVTIHIQWRAPLERSAGTFSLGR